MNDETINQFLDECEPTEEEEQYLEMMQDYFDNDAMMQEFLWKQVFQCFQHTAQVQHKFLLSNTFTMQNKHQEHPEDTILTGDLSAINLLYNFTHASVKIDGSPAIVWGTDPATGTFFVGTKAVFNKKKIRIAHSHEEIDLHYEDAVAEVLHDCFDLLPRTDRIFQGDFIGFGNERFFTPNTITYEFPEFIHQDVVIAPHTEYFAEDDLRNAVSYSLSESFEDTDNVKWVQPIVDRVPCGVNAPKIDVSKIKFLDNKTATDCKKIINAFIREGKDLSHEILTLIFDCEHLASLYLTVIEMKEDLMDSFILTNCPTAYIGDLKVKQEGFTIRDDSGRMIKLVDREVFSMFNFILPKRWDTPVQ